MIVLRLSLALILSVPFWPCLHGQQQAHLDLDSPFAPYVEDEFPFFSQILDARQFGEHPEPTNLTPRGIIVRLGHGFWGCFDPDLLRWSLIWRENGQGEYLTMDGMATGSYRLPNRKAPVGQESLPKPIGSVLSATPARPGWWIGEEPLNKDPRESGQAEDGELGLGPIPASLGRFSGIRISKGGVQIEYEIGSVTIVEQVHALASGVRRDVFVSPHENPLLIAVGKNALRLANPDPSEAHSNWRTIAPADQAQQWTFVTAGNSSGISGDQVKKFGPAGGTRFWPKAVAISPTPPSAADLSAPFLVDDLGLPVPNPWKRNIRLSGLDFFSDGRAAVCTFDGDVWIVTGLEEGSRQASWSRFASGLHEPQAVCIVEEVLFVSDRNGIIRLLDTDHNGEADWYENFSNLVAQTAETREFAMDMVATADGGFYLAKGGQIGSTRGKYNGTILKVSPDGRSYELIATGLRQPYLGYDLETGILTSSDQQGHWKPATPIYQIDPGRYYGFQPAKLKGNAVHPAPIAPPEIWIPHFINQSGAAQVWMKGKAKMGALNGSLIHIGYNRPELFRLYLDKNRKQGAVVPILSGFPSGLLKGRINPKDGRLYLCGFEIWGTSGSQISGLYRMRPSGEPSWLPNQIIAGTRGVLLSFDQELSPELASDLGRYSVDRWNYQQTHNYGSGNFKLDGEPGQESVPVTSVKISSDRRSLFIGLPDMQPSHTLQVTYRLPLPDSMLVESAYLTVRALEKITLPDHGFQDDEVDLTPKQTLPGAARPPDPTAQLGREVAMRYGCIACHANGDPDLPSLPAAGAEETQLTVGPPWVGLWKSRRTFTDHSFIKAVDETYLRESILDPGRRVAMGYESEKTGVGMPSYLGVLKDHEIDSIILYIKSLAKNKK